MTDGNPLDHLTGGGVENDELWAAGDQNALAIWRELEPISPLRPGRARRGHFLCRDVDHREGAILRIGDPYLLALGRDVEALRAIAAADDGFVPVLARHRAAEFTRGWSARTARAWCSRRWAGHPQGLHFDEADGAGADVGGDDALLVGRYIDHVGAVLAGAQDPVDLVRGGIIAANGFGGLCCEPGLAADEGEAVRAVKGPEIDGANRPASGQIDFGEGVVGAESVVGDVCRPAVGGCDDLMGIVADGHAGHDLERGGIDAAEGLRLLGD